MIFNFVNSSWSLLSKTTNFPNVSPLFIVQFDQSLNILQKVLQFSMDSTLTHHYPNQFMINSLN